MYRGIDIVAKAAKEDNYSITWGYICDCMKKDFGLSRNSTKWLSVGEVERMIDTIWENFYMAVQRKKLEIEGAKE